VRRDQHHALHRSDRELIQQQLDGSGVDLVGGLVERRIWREHHLVRARYHLKYAVRMAW